MSSEKQEVMDWLKKDSGRSQSSLFFFFKRGSNLEYVRAGSTFQRVHRDSMGETAQVFSVGTDSCRHGFIRNPACALSGQFQSYRS